jgi:hypothetical protein
MPGTAVDQYLYMLDQAFEGNDEHSFLADLNSLRDDDWNWAPPGGNRTIAHIVGHVAACKLMYDHYAFGEGTWNWETPLSTALSGLDFNSALTVDMSQHPPEGSEPSPQQMLAYLKEGHRRLRASVALLDDAGLVQQRALNWGGTAETRWIISVMIEHDLFHAGEINHIRALRQGNDRWAWELENQG